MGDVENLFFSSSNCLRGDIYCSVTIIIMLFFSAGNDLTMTLKLPNCASALVIVRDKLGYLDWTPTAIYNSLSENFADMCLERCGKSVTRG